MKPRRALDIARAALARGPLVLIGDGQRNPPHYRFGRRLFNLETVKRLIESGEAVREGNIVRAANA